MKKLFTLIIIIASALPATAQQMFIVHNNGNSSTMELNEFKQMTFNGTTVSIEDINGNKNSATMGDIERIHFGNATSIKNAGIGDKELITYITKDEIAVDCTAGTTVIIYDVIGSQVLCTRLKTEGGKISIANLPKGIYILKANDRTAKIIKR